MFDAIQSVLVSLWQQDFTALLAVNSSIIIYMLIAFFICLESGFLPAAPLPCDSIVVLAGTLCAVDVLHPGITFVLLVCAAGSGSWLAYIQGRWLNRLPRVQSWIKKVPQKQLNTVDFLLSRHGLFALFAARFIPVVRCLLPTMMGIRLQEAPRFHYFTWLSAIMWVGLLAGLGYFLPQLPEPISRVVTMGLMAAPVITLALALMTALYWRMRKAFRVLYQTSKGA